MFSRKQYVQIAAAIYEGTYNHSAKVGISRRLADIFAEDNPRFDRMQFLHAAIYNGDSRYADEVEKLRTNPLAIPARKPVSER